MLNGHQEGRVLWCQTGPSIQQSHAEGMQHLEAEAIKKEGKDHLSFLATCGAAIWVSPQRPWGFGDPFHLLLGNVPLYTLLNIHPQ